MTTTTPTATRPTTATAAADTATATTATRTPTRPVQNPLPFYNHHNTATTRPPNPNNNTNNNNNPSLHALHPPPFPPSARGFLPRQSSPARPSDTLPLFSNTHNHHPPPGAYHPRAIGLAYWPASVRPQDADVSVGVGGGFQMPNHHEQNQPHHRHHHINSVNMMRQHPHPPTHLPHQTQMNYGVGGLGLGLGLGLAVGGGSPPVKGVPVAGQPKAAPPIPDSNGNKNSRNRSKDETIITVRNRKVRVTEGATLYALCRSWLRNGYPEEIQPNYGNVVKSLPRPLPIQQVDTKIKKEGEEEENEGEEGGESVDQLSTEELLARHIKRAKKVRARFREERLKRIERYKTRLALLLPPQVEQLRNDTAAGN